jgi:hypothetical protein
LQFSGFGRSLDSEDLPPGHFSLIKAMLPEEGLKDLEEFSSVSEDKVIYIF